ncbi:MAG TPA: helix-turn-helix transcriptional regulator [Sphingopyxis sp.]|uniref:helix-turn-helix domain-containing protein n=1 Tax=Sphingopyxis sp. TaxID=1908224 RepID=UPI002E31A794|nr:helix-turn-helix transcriptional regulator [Sphingopyxis sp.]HEX2812600.1 helix-turn-helix transcriptional regulator [Sphingopyxis sp.]
MARSLRTPKHRQLQSGLADARKAAGLTQVQLAERLGRPQSFVAKYEVGERRIDVVEFCEIADALKLDASALLSSIFMDRR